MKGKKNGSFRVQRAAGWCKADADPERLSPERSAEEAARLCVGLNVMLASEAEKWAEFPSTRSGTAEAENSFTAFVSRI